MSGKKETELKKYKREGKNLKPPLAQINITPSSWINERLPDILWAVLVVSQLEREQALNYFRYCLKYLEDKPNLHNVTLSGISYFPDEHRAAFIKHIVSFEDVQIAPILKPLILFKTLPSLEEWKICLGLEADPKKDWGIIADALRKCMWHQTQEATDCRWVKIAALVLTGKIHVTEEMVREILFYPAEGDQQKVRAMIRATEIVPGPQETISDWPKNFWRESYDSTSCYPEREANPEIVTRQDELQKELEGFRKDYFDQTVKARHALIDHFFKTLQTSGIDSKHEAVFGLAFYGLGLFIENNFYRTGLSVNGRSMLRSLFEIYITLAYLVKKEKEEPQAWDDYRTYGSGQANLIYRKFEEANLHSSAIDKEAIERIANEDKWVEFVPINLGHWDSSDLRKMSEYLDEKTIYDKYYAYTSGFIHGNWSAVRESVFQKCYNPLHRLHRIPTYDLPLLPSVTSDMLELTNKILDLVSACYPNFDNRITSPEKP